MKRQKSALLTVKVNCIPAFQDLDIMNVVWHGRYWQFIEQARQALFDYIGFGYEKMIAEGCQFPIVQAEIKYIRPIGLNQAFIISADLLEFENRVKIRFTFYDKATGLELAKAESTQVAVLVGDNKLQFLTPESFQICVKNKLEDKKGII